MNQRLIWNFEFVPQTATLPPELLIKQEPEALKWEARFFWPDDTIIALNTIDNSLLDLGNYHQKHRDDYYYLLEENNYNIKRRHHQLWYKPLLQQTTTAMAFGAKITFDDIKEQAHKTPLSEPLLTKNAQQMMQKGVEVYVKKEAFIYKFVTTPVIKFELARIEIQNKIYLSACIEGKSLVLVERITELLLGKQNPRDYVTFLKNILQS